MPLEILLKGPGRMKKKYAPVLFFIVLYLLQTVTVYSESPAD